VLSEFLSGRKSAVCSMKRKLITCGIRGLLHSGRIGIQSSASPRLGKTQSRTVFRQDRVPAFDRLAIYPDDAPAPEVDARNVLVERSAKGAIDIQALRPVALDPSGREATCDIRAQDKKQGSFVGEGH